MAHWRELVQHRQRAVTRRPTGGSARPVREIRNILSAFDRLVAAGEAAVLASVVAVSGSTYRRPGARTLILRDETTIGLVSGGCLEGDLILRAREVREDGRPRIAHYDSTEQSDIVWGLGLGCAGMVEVLLERVDEENPGPLELLRDCLRNRQPGVIATALGRGVCDPSNPSDSPEASTSSNLPDPADPSGPSDASGPADPSGSAGLSEPPDSCQRWSLKPGGDLVGHSPSSSRSLTRWLEQEAQRCLAAGHSALRRSEDPTDSGEPAQRVLFEYVPRTLRLVIFGTGADAVPLVELADSLGWDVLVVNNRVARTRPDHFPAELAMEALDPNHAQACIEAIGLDERSAAVVMTHLYLDDREILRCLLGTSIRYIGLLGPRQRGRDLLEDLRAEGDWRTAGDPESLFSPAGLDLGADSPEQIALAIGAEIQAVFSERSGGWLRDRRDPIHRPTSS
jgi:xanthine dehydrogenase accessory factor